VKLTESQILHHDWIDFDSIPSLWELLTKYQKNLLTEFIPYEQWMRVESHWPRCKSLMALPNSCIDPTTIVDPSFNRVAIPAKSQNPKSRFSFRAGRLPALVGGMKVHNFWAFVCEARYETVGLKWPHLLQKKKRDINPSEGDTAAIELCIVAEL
jgi:hypothetical protein